MNLAVNIRLWGLWLIGLCLMGCGDADRLVVYADPWAYRRIEPRWEQWQELHPEVQTELRVLSTEVIDAHLRYGQAIDLVFYLQNPGGELVLGGQILRKQELFREELVKVKVVGPVQEQLGGEGCMVWSGSGRPLRRYAESRRDRLGIDKDACLIVADFYPQLEHYLLQAWVSGGWVLGSLAEEHADRLEVVQSYGEEDFSIGIATIQQAPHPQMRDQFWDFWLDEK